MLFTELLTSWHDDTEGFALWALSPPVGGSDLEDVPFSWCETVDSGRGGAATVCHALHSEWLHGRGVGQDVFCAEVEHEKLL